MVPKEEQDATGQSSYFPSPDKETLQVPEAEEPATRGSLYLPSIEMESLRLSKFPVFVHENTSSKKNFCYRAFGNIFPYLFFISVLVISAFLGAVLFRVIERGKNDSNVEFEAFLNKLWTFYERNKAGSEEERKTNFMTVTTKMTQDEVKHDWLISSKDWSLVKSLFFCCTVFTTVGYGNIYPRTRLGKIVCVLYALFGIPLMFLVMTTIGDVLTSILSMIYNNYKNHHVLNLVPQIRRHRNTNTKADPSNQVFPHTEVEKSGHNFKVQKDNKTTHKHPKEQHQNMELFEKIVRRENENMLHVTPQLERSISCPNLVEYIKSRQSSHRSLRDVGRIVEHFDIPILIIACIVFAYISLGAAFLPFWETQLDFVTAFYFCFITFTTIGFGDIELHNTSHFLFCSMYIIVAMEIVFITFKLLQDRLFHVYETIVIFATRWDVD